MSGIEHIDGARVTKTVDGVDMVETFGWEDAGEVLPADAVNTVASQCLAALIDKEAVLIEGLWSGSVLGDVDLKELDGSGLQGDEAITIALAQDGEGTLLRIEVVEVKH